LLFALPAKADKFWLADPAAAKNTAAGSSPEVIEGVLVAEDQDAYHIRVVGGELLLAKKSVFKVEKDGLTLEAVVKAEKEAAEKAVAQNRDRELQQTEARKVRDIQVLEASARRTRAEVAEAQAQPVAPAAQPVFDPVLGVVRGAGYGSQQDLMIDAQLAWQMTRDPRYLKMLRQLRRAR
jgi:hypothetical protein